MRHVLGWLAAILAHLALLLSPAWLLGTLPRLLGDPASLVFLALAGGFCGAELLAAGRLSQPRRSRSAADFAARRLAIGTCLVILAMFWCGLIERGHELAQPRAWAAGWSWHVGGGLLMLVGIGLRVAAMTTLRAWFVTEISVPGNQPLVQRGIYGRLRHPSEAGTLAIALGAGLLLQSTAGLLLWLCGLLPLVRWRLRLEERELATAFGARFDRYAARVPRLLPRLG